MLFYIQKSQATTLPVISLSITATRQWQKTALQRALEGIRPPQKSDVSLKLDKVQDEMKDGW